MKNANIYRLITLAMLLISCVIPTKAETVEVDGILYTLGYDKATPASKPGGYSGDIAIPNTITINGLVYHINFSGDAFKNCLNLKSIRTDSIITTSNAYNFLFSFSGCTSLETVTMPKYEGTSNLSLQILENTYYECGKLSKIENFPTKIDTYYIGTNSFLGCKSLNPLEYIELSKVKFQNNSNSSYTQIFGTFAYCNITNLSIPENWTKIPNEIFYQCPITELTIPSTITSIGNYAFYTETYPTKNFIPHEGLENIGNCIFYGNFENLTIPSTLKSIGNGMLSADELKSVSIADGNTCFSIKNNALYSNESNVKTLRCLIGGNGYKGESIYKDDDVVNIGEYAFNNIPITGYEFPMLKHVARSAFSGSSLEKVEIKKGVTYEDWAFSSCVSLKEVIIEDGVTELPNYLFDGCSNLKNSPIIPSSLTTFKDRIFNGCNFTSIKLHSSFESFTASALPNSIISVESLNPFPPIIYNYKGDGNDSHIDMANVTLTCPQSSVDLYQQDYVWGTCIKIIGNPEWGGFADKCAIPDGLWFAQKSGNICYVQNGNVIDTEISAGAHPFQMQIYNGVLYVADAGESHYYNSNGIYSGSGDGQLYKLEKFGETYAKTEMLVHGDLGIDFGDPYTCFIDQSTGDIYASERNSGIYRFNVNDMDWYNVKYYTSDFYNDNSKYFVKHHWLNYYGAGIAYGAIIRGFQRDSKGVNWLLCDFNGQGIYRFKDSDIHSERDINNANLPFGRLLTSSNLSAMYLDEANEYLYVFSPNNDSGLYRIPLSIIDDKTDIDWYSSTCSRNLERIDKSVAAAENSTANEGVYVRQITGDGKNIYWSFISADDPAESGIKMIPATGTPTVSYVLKGVEAYGLAVSNFDTSGIEAINADNDQPHFVNIIGNRVVAIDDVTMVVYNISGITETTIKLVAEESITLDNLAAGVHIIKATNANGATQTAKIIL